MNGCTEIRRGEVFLADLTGSVGCEQSGSRPVVVVQNDMGNRYSPTVIVAPVTSSTQKTRLPTHVSCGVQSGLERSSCILLEQLRTIDKSRLGRYICCLGGELMTRVNRAMEISLGLQTPR